MHEWFEPTAPALDKHPQEVWKVQVSVEVYELARLNHDRYCGGKNGQCKWRSAPNQERNYWFRDAEEELKRRALVEELDEADQLREEVDEQ